MESKSPSLLRRRPSNNKMIIFLGPGCSGKPTTIQQLAKTIMNTTNTKTPLQYKPKPKGDPHGGYAETTQMKKLLEWEPKSK